MPESFARIASLLLAGAFLWAGVAKALGYARWRAVVARYALPAPLGSVTAPVVPAVEISIALVILLVSPRAGAVLALAALSLFSLAVLRARSINGDKLPCGCFGGREERHYSAMLWRNFLLAVLAALVLRGPEQAITLPGSLPERSELVPVALIAAGVIMIVWMAWQISGAWRRREHS